MQLPLAVPDPPEPESTGPELVQTPHVVRPHEPEQLPLIRMLELVTRKVTRKVETIEAGQRTITTELREIKASLPVQRRPLSTRTQELHVHVIWTRRNGLCPCCQTEPVCRDGARLEGSEFDHWFSRDKNRPAQTWLICGPCNGRLRDTDFKVESRSAFEAYVAALRPFLSRQMPLGLLEAGRRYP